MTFTFSIWTPIADAHVAFATPEQLSHGDIDCLKESFEEVRMNGLSLTQVLIMVVVALLLATGQLLFKHGAVLAAPATDFSGAIKLFSHPVILGAICLYALVTFIWVYMLQHVSLSRAYPFFALGFVLVPIAASYVFREPMTARYLMGMLLVIAGLYVSCTGR